jgi:LysR family nitrogen assimilation transcriptional regulator
LPSSALAEDIAHRRISARVLNDALLQRELPFCLPAGVPLSAAAEVVRAATLAQLQQRLAQSPEWRGVRPIDAQSQS